jgi:hypothetical protein
LVLTNSVIVNITVCALSRTYDTKADEDASVSAVKPSSSNYKHTDFVGRDKVKHGVG